MYRATDFLLIRAGDLKRPYALAITAYCLSICLTDHTRALSAWKKLKSLAKPGIIPYTELFMEVLY